MVNGLKEGQSSLIEIIGLGTINLVTETVQVMDEQVIFPVYPVLKTFVFVLYQNGDLTI